MLGTPIANAVAEGLAGLTPPAGRASVPKDIVVPSVVSPMASFPGVRSTFETLPSSAENTINDLTFQPPCIMNVLRYNEGQRILEICMWLPSAVKHSDIVLHVSEDYKHLDVMVPMDPNIGDGWAIHGDLVHDGTNLTKKQKMSNVRVYLWNTLIADMRSANGALPWFKSSIELPIQVCSKTILREAAKESPSGAKFLVIELLVEDTKFQPVGKKRTVQMIDSAEECPQNAP